MGMILRIASSRIVGQGDIVGRSGYFSLNLSANSVMRGRLDARRTLKSLVADLRGYSNLCKVFNHNEPCIIFGDHTRVVKYVDFNFIVGGDGVKILCPKVNTKWSYYIITYVTSQIENKGYSRHYGQLVKFKYLLPPKSEQIRIVQKIEELFASLDNIQKALEA